MTHNSNVKNREGKKATGVQIKKEITEMHATNVNIIALISEHGLQFTISTITHIVCSIYSCFY
jgi:hypothetical protein